MNDQPQAEQGRWTDPQTRADVAFTLIDLLVVIAIICLLTGLLLPALNKARTKAEQIQCASATRRYNLAILMYIGDNQDTIPPMGIGIDPYFHFDWGEMVLPYLLGRPFRGSDLDLEEFRSITSCPSGGRGYVGEVVWEWDYEDVAGHWGALLIYGGRQSLVKAPSILKPAEGLLLIDTARGFMESPVEPTPLEEDPIFSDNRFVHDSDGDGQVDSDIAYLGTGYVGWVWKFNGARPKIHNNGCNVGLLDGHVERVSYRELWDVDEHNEVTHAYWYPE